MLNYIFKFLNWIVFSFRNAGRVWICHMRHSSFICPALAIIVVIFYCSVEFCFAFNEVPKFSPSSFNFTDRLLEFREKVFVPPGESNGIDTLKGVKDFISERSSSSNEGAMLLGINRETITNQSHNKNTASTKQPNIRSGEMDSEDYHTVLLSLIPMWIMTLYWFFYMLFISTQQLIYEILICPEFRPLPYHNR